MTVEEFTLCMLIESKEIPLAYAVFGDLECKEKAIKHQMAQALLEK